VPKLDEFCTHLSNQYNIKPKVLCTDRGGEYTGEVTEKILCTQGIKHEMTASDTPQENGISKRLNGLIMDKVRALLTNVQLPDELWPQTFLYTIYLLNRQPSGVIGDKTPYEEWNNSVSDLSYLCTFSCYALVLNKSHKQKLAPRSFPTIYVGHNTNCLDHYKLWNLAIRNTHFHTFVGDLVVSFSTNSHSCHKSTSSCIL
jgi:hypothetical protein